MIRLRLHAQDLMRIRIAPTLGPLAETVSAAALIRAREPNLIFSSWKQTLYGRLGPQVRPLAGILPRDREGLDLTALVGRAETIGEGVEALLSAPAQDLRAEIEWLCKRNTPAWWPWPRLDRDTELRKELGAAITSFHACAVGPYWPRVRGFLQTERARHAQVLASAGINEFLAGLCPPLIQWLPPFLILHGKYERTLDIDLAGRGLVVVPSVFRNPYPFVSFDLADPEGPEMLIYPAVRDLATAASLWASGRGDPALAALLGRTRSAVLEAIADGCGTSELASRAGISAAAASQHAAVLRHAGLITTHRDGRAVLHELTPLGSTLLTG
jgi:DNA-binding transcriptional ArsR family regulator